jgi:CCR4-NOT transcription complex subunit 6
VLSWNILCEKAATPQQYGYTPSGALSWDFRKENILQEIQSQDTDFVCLQEVDMETFKEFLSMKLAYNGYKGAFFQRPRHKTMSEKDAKAVDGCATFWKHDKYILLDKQVIDIANIAINRPDMKNQSDIFNRVMPRDHIAVVALFENRLTGSRLIIANTHLFWDPAYADVKLIQIAIVLENVNKLTEKYARWPPCKDKKTYALTDENAEPESPPDPPQEPAPSMEYSSNTQVPLLVCGDFNSTPDSTIYQLLSTGSVSKDISELKDFQYGNFTRDGIAHPFALRSAYSNLDKTPEALPFTNYTPGYRGVIDHIWYSTNTLENTSLLGPVDPEYMKRVPGFPNYHFPSDHLVMLAEFSIKGRKKDKPITEPDFGPSSRRRD